MSALFQDLRYGFRLLIKNPGFTLISVVTLGLGIGLTTMMFSIVYGAMMRGLPFEEGDQLVAVTHANPARDWSGMSIDIHDFEIWREQQQSFEGIAGYYSGTVNVRGTERAERYDGAWVSANVFRLVRVQPALGRGFQDGEDRAGAEPVVIIGHEMWQNRFAGDPGIVGTTLRANGEEMTIIGVMPEGFAFPDNNDLWLTLRQSAAAQERGTGTFVNVVGRLRDGVTLDQANLQMSAITSRIQLENPGVNEGLIAEVQPFTERFIGDEPRQLLLTMLGAVFFVLLIACANVANLLLSRAALRMKEVGIRSAIGASRARVMLQFLTEPLALALLGAALGVALAWIGIRLFNNAIVDTNPPFWIIIQLDGPALLFVLGVTLFATLASGVLPAFRATGGDMNEILKDESRGASSFRIGKLSRALVIFEIALSCGLLVAAGLMVKSVAKLRTIDFGFEPASVFTARVGLPEAEYPDSAAQVRFYEDLDERLSALPEARNVVLADALPGLYPPFGTFAVEGQAYAEERDYPRAPIVTISPGFFELFGRTPRAGRDFGAQDLAGSMPVAIVNEAFVARYFPDGDALGRQIRFGGPETQQPWRAIVGIVPDMHLTGIENEDPEGVYIPATQSPRRFMSIAALGRGGDPLGLTVPVRDAVAAVDPDIPLYFVNTLSGRIREQTWFYTVFGSIFMVMGFVALFLAAIGLYGVMSFSVSRRTREMGVRMALGASGRDVLGLILRQGVLQLAIGLTIGVALAAGVSQLLSIVLFGVEPRDPVIFALIVAVLSAVGVIASFVPARRATRVDPMVALRYE
jgi:putative ABC transport system permease protein